MRVEVLINSLDTYFTEAFVLNGLSSVNNGKFLIVIFRQASGCKLSNLGKSIATVVFIISVV